MKKLTRVEKKRRRRKRFFRLLLLFTITIIVLIFAFNSELFTIDYIIVEGNNKLDYDLIVNTSLIDIGENIFRVRTSDGEKALNKLSYIKDVSINRKLPNKININLEERNATHQIKVLNNYILLDKEGYALEILNEKVVNIPTFIGFKLSDINIDQNIFEDNKNTGLYDFFIDDEIITIVNEMKEINYLEEENNINIDLNNGISVAFGPLDNVEYKLKMLDKILLDIEKKQIKCKMIIMNKGENPILVTDS